jgi:hypothetical protein
MAAILDAVPAATAIQPAAGVALICDQIMTASALAEGRPAGGSELEIYASVAAAILHHSGLSVVLHSRTCSGAAGAAAAIARAAELVPDMQGRLRVVAAEPLEHLLPSVDVLVSFASPGLIAGCRDGLKPVQIGRAVIGSAAFSHIFPDVAGFAVALAAGGVAGRLSLREYAQFEEFCRRVAGGAGMRRLGPRRLAADPIVRACRQPDATGRRAMRAISSVFANPFAAWRLLRAGLGATTAG